MDLKRILALVLVCVVLLAGCGEPYESPAAVVSLSAVVIGPPNPSGDLRPAQERAAVWQGDRGIDIYQVWEVHSRGYIELESFDRRPDGTPTEIRGGPYRYEVNKGDLFAFTWAWDWQLDEMEDHPGIWTVDLAANGQVHRTVTFNVVPDYRKLAEPEHPAYAFTFSMGAFPSVSNLWSEVTPSLYSTFAELTLATELMRNSADQLRGVQGIQSPAGALPYATFDTRMVSEDVAFVQALRRGEPTGSAFITRLESGRWKMVDLVSGSLTDDEVLAAIEKMRSLNF